MRCRIFPSSHFPHLLSPTAVHVFRVKTYHGLPTTMKMTFFLNSISFFFLFFLSQVFFAFLRYFVRFFYFLFFYKFSVLLTSSIRSSVAAPKMRIFICSNFVRSAARLINPGQTLFFFCLLNSFQQYLHCFYYV